MSNTHNGIASRDVRDRKSEFSSIVHLARYRAQVQPRDRAYVFLKDGETEAGVLTYEALDRRARAIAVELRDHVEPGARVALAYPPGLDFIAAFLGCLYAGVVAVPVYPPARSSDWARFEKIAMNAGANAVLTHAASVIGARLAASSAGSGGRIRYLAIEDVRDDRADEWADPLVHLGSLAFLQYTSGSTGTPKGVMVTHGNLIHNQGLIKEGFQHGVHTLVVGWLPLYHDMGLIGNVLQPLYLGVPSVLMAPAAFIVKPLRWLQAISRYRATTSGGPNFAYDLCVRRIDEDQLSGLDLSCWDVAFNGSEKVRAETLVRFTERFSPSGFRKSAFLSCYGLAESTLFVTGARRSVHPAIMSIDSDALQQHRILPAGSDTRNAATLVSSGAVLDLQVLIVDPASRIPVAPRTVGEIWIRGESVARGYWNAPDATDTTFNAYLADTGEGPFMRTGDLGFMEEGQLYVTGRAKEMIIIRGRNYYPQDIEAAVQASHASLRIDGGAAFAIEIDGAESLVVVQEVNRTCSRDLDIEAVKGAAHFAVTAELGLALHELVLLKQGSLPKTSSGKTRRRACRDAYLAGTLEILDLPASRLRQRESAFE
jgi:acyl-CoA synthetase (AMP-forming)/AMP-acid ligase II